MIAAVAGTELKIEKNTQLTQGTVGMTLGVQLSEEWNGLSVTAVFSAGGVFRDVAVEGEEITLPWELFVQPGHKLFLSVYGALADGSIVRRTNIASLGEILPSLAPSGNPPEAPTPTRADQIQALAEEALAAAQALREDALSGAFDGADGMSPTASVSKTGDTATITITDASGTTTATVKDGERIDPELIYNTYPARAASGQVVRFDDGAAGVPVKSLRVAIEPVQAGSGDPSPENARPISGRTGMTVTRAGKNLFNKNNYLSFNGYFSNSSHTITANSGHTILWIPCLPNTTYTVSRMRTISNERFEVSYSDAVPASGSAIAATYRTIVNDVPADVGQTMSLTITTGANARYLILWAWWTNSIDPAESLQIELGDAATAYEPYTAAVVPISWEEEAGTVYGGTLDVTTGELTVDTRLFRSFPVSVLHEIGDYVRVTSVYANTVFAGNGDVCNIAPYLSSYTAESLHFYCQGATIISVWPKALFADLSAETIHTWLNSHCEVAARLAHPQVYQLSPQQLSTLLGTNTLWADAGACSVEYRADPSVTLAELLARLENT